MDLDELNDNFQTSLEQLKQDQDKSNRAILQELQALKNSSKTSTNSQTDSLIFSELRTLLNEQNKQGKQNLTDNAEKLKNAVSTQISLLTSSVSQSQSELKKITDGLGEDIKKNVKKEIGNSLSEITFASQNLRTNTRRNIFYSAGLTLLLLLLAVGGILFVWKWHDGTKIAEMRIEKMLESERADIQKKAVEDYKASKQFRADASELVAKNIEKIDIGFYLYRNMQSEDLKKWKELNQFYKTYLKDSYEQYKAQK